MGELYCLSVGCGDASVIISESATFLIDCNNIRDFTHLLPKDKNLLGVFITHQHSDHYSGLIYLKENNYNITHLIYSPYSRRKEDLSVTLEEWNEFNRLKDYFSGKGTKLYSPYRQKTFNEPYWKINGIRFEIIGPHEKITTSDTREIHDACLVVGTYLGTRRCLFTGDASDTNLKAISDTTNNYCNDILHASHHGSLNGAEINFLKKANTQYTIISTNSGVYDNVPHPTALSRYKNHTQYDVRRTDVDGSWKWTF
jgi:beta-lactamase superfamily II metal-dependent hydrolase